MLAPAVTPLLLTLSLSALAATPAVEDRFGGFVRTSSGFDRPVDAAFTERGTLLVVEAGAHRVVELSDRENVLRSWGGPGSAPGQFLLPSAVDVDAEGTLAVADTGNHRVQLFGDTDVPPIVLGGAGSEPGRFRSPEGVALDGPRVVVADTGNQRIQVLNRAGEVLRSWGEFGSGPGQFRWPVDVVVDAGHNLYVADRGNHRVQRFRPDGSFDAEWGARGPWPGLFSSPTGLAVDELLLVVVDRDNHRLQGFDRDGNWIYEWGLHANVPGEGQGKLHYPRRVVIEPHEHDGAAQRVRRAVVVEPLDGRLQWFELIEHEHDGASASAKRLATGGPAPHFGPSLAVAGDLAALYEPETQSIELYDVSGHMPIRISRLGGFGDGWGRFRELAGLALVPDSWTLVASDAGARKLSSFRLDHRADDPPAYDPALAEFLVGADLPVLLERRPWPGAQPESVPDIELGLEPGALAVHPDGRLLVADRRTPRALVFDADWSPRGELVNSSEVQSVTGLAVDAARGRVWVLDSVGCRAIAVALGAAEDGPAAGPAVGALGTRGREPGELWEPSGILVTRDDEVLVSDAGRDRVLRFDGEGAFLGEWGGSGLAAGQFHRPSGLGQDERGRIHVVDHGNHRVQLFEPDGTFLLAFGSRLYVKPTLEKPAR